MRPDAPYWVSSTGPPVICQTATLTRIPGSAGSAGLGVAWFGVTTVVIVEYTMPPGAYVAGFTSTSTLRLSIPNPVRAYWCRAGLEAVSLNHISTIPLYAGFTVVVRLKLNEPEGLGDVYGYWVIRGADGKFESWTHTCPYPAGGSEPSLMLFADHVTITLSPPM